MNPKFISKKLERFDMGSRTCDAADYYVCQRLFVVSDMFPHSHGADMACPQCHPDVKALKARVTDVQLAKISNRNSELIAA